MLGPLILSRALINIGRAGLPLWQALRSRGYHQVKDHLLLGGSGGLESSAGHYLWPVFKTDLAERAVHLDSFTGFLNSKKLSFS